MSIDALTAYLVTNKTNSHFSEKIIIATGFEYFLPDVEQDIFLVYDLEDVVESKINVTKLDIRDNCDICTSELSRPNSRTFRSTDDFDQFLQTNSEFKKLPEYLGTQLFIVCEECQSSIVTDLHELLPNTYKVSRKI